MINFNNFRSVEFVENYHTLLSCILVQVLRFGLLFIYTMYIQSVIIYIVTFAPEWSHWLIDALCGASDCRDVFTINMQMCS